MISHTVATLVTSKIESATIMTFELTKDLLARRSPRGTLGVTEVVLSKSDFGLRDFFVFSREHILHVPGAAELQEEGMCVGGAGGGGGGL